MRSAVLAVQFAEIIYVSKYKRVVRERERGARSVPHQSELHSARGALACSKMVCHHGDYRRLFQIVCAVAGRISFSLRDHYVQLDLELLLKNCLD